MGEQSTETRLALLEESIPRIERNTDRILIILQGSGDSSGLKGKVDMNKSSIKRLWLACGGFVTLVISVLSVAASRFM